MPGGGMHPVRPIRLTEGKTRRLADRWKAAEGFGGTGAGPLILGDGGGRGLSTARGCCSCVVAALDR